MQTKFFKHVARATTLGVTLALLAACAAPAVTPAAAPTQAPATAAPEPTAATTEAATTEPTSAPTEVPTAEATAEVTTTATSLTAKQISFDDMGLADGKVMRNENRPATAMGDANAPGPGAGEPASIRFTFPGDTVDGYVSPMQRQIVFYSAADYQALLQAEGVAEEQNPISQLTALLAEKPATISGTLPMLPQIPGSQVFHAQMKYLTFKSGAGVRYLTRYTFDVSPIANDNLFYTFQGLSSDSQHYVSFFYPIQTSALPKTSADAKTEAAAMEKGYDAYILEVTSKLDQLAADGFTPELAKLDGLIESLALSQADATADVSAGATTTETQPILSGVVQVTMTEVIRVVPAVPETAQDGECFAASIASTRADAYRCSVGNAIYDPCLTAADGKTLVCDIDPTGKQTSFKLNPTKPLPDANKADLPQHPWFIRLSDGAICNFATGGSGLIAEQRINYYCSNKSVIVGDLTPGTIWQALLAAPTDAEGTKFGEPYKVVVAAVWE